MSSISGHPGEKVNRSRETRRRGLFALGLLLFALLVFRSLLAPDAVLFCTDDNVGAMSQRKALLPDAFIRGWNDRVFIGVREPVMPTWTNLLLWGLPLRVFHNGIHALDLVLASLFLAALLRRRGVGWPGCVVGVLTAYWVGSNFTLTYAGHIGKFGVLMFAALALWLTDIAAGSGRRAAAWSLLAGGAWGGMFLEQADLALFFAAALGVFVPLWIYARHRGSRVEWIRRVLPMAGAAALIAFHPLWSGFETSIRGAAVESGDAETRWNFITQWSWPPEETVDFVAPGFTGWRTNEPAGPYWGRMGRSPEGTPRGEGLRNFKLENQYIGAIPLLLALLAIAGAVRRGRRTDPGEPAESVMRRRETFVWAAVGLATFVLALGKFTPLYRLVMRLPAFSSVRAPVKWLQPFQIAVAVLAAYGMDGYLRSWTERSWGRLLPPLGVALAGTLAMGLAAQWLGRGHAPLAERLTVEWGATAPTILRNADKALARGAAEMAMGALLLAAPLLAGGRRRSWLAPACAWAAAALPAAAALYLSRYYVQLLPRSLIADNEAVRLVRRDIGPNRLALATQTGPYGYWLTFLFPHEDIRTLNFTQMPRMPADVRRFLERVGTRSARYWRSAGAPLIMMPAALWQGVLAEGAWPPGFEVAGAFRFESADDGGFTAVPARPDLPGAQLLVRDHGAAERFRLVYQWRTADDETALDTLAAGEESSAEESLIGPGFPRPDPPPKVPERGTVRVKSLRPGRSVVRAMTETPALLRVADHYDGRWRAALDGAPAEIVRADYLFTGVFIPPGEHEVQLVYRVSPVSLIILGAGVLLCALAAIAAVVPIRPGEGAAS